MSRLEHREAVTEVPAARFADAIVDFEAHGVPIRTLVEHGVFALDWLAANAALPLHIVSRDLRGELATQVVHGVDLLLHGYAAGWTPSQSEDDAPLPCFEEVVTWQPVEWQVEGVWFAASDCLDPETGAPLTLPGEMAKARKRMRQFHREWLQSSLQMAKDKVVRAVWNPKESMADAAVRAQAITENWRGNPRHRLYVDAAALACGHAERGGGTTFWQIFQVLRRQGEDSAYELMRSTERAS